MASTIIGGHLGQRARNIHNNIGLIIAAQDPATGEGTPSTQSLWPSLKKHQYSFKCEEPEGSAMNMDWVYASLDVVLR